MLAWANCAHEARSASTEVFVCLRTNFVLTPACTPAKCHGRRHAQFLPKASTGLLHLPPLCYAFERVSELHLSEIKDAPKSDTNLLQDSGSIAEDNTSSGTSSVASAVPCPASSSNGSIDANNTTSRIKQRDSDVSKRFTIATASSASTSTSTSGQDAFVRAAAGRVNYRPVATARGGRLTQQSMQLAVDVAQVLARLPRKASSASVLERTNLDLAQMCW